MSAIHRGWITVIVLCLVYVIVPRLPLMPALAATTWYVSSSGSDSNDCLTSPTACRTIGGAIGKASSGDTISIAAGTYDENLTQLYKNMTLQGAGASQTIIDAGGVASAIGVLSSTVLTISGVTLQDGVGEKGGYGGAIYNQGFLTLTNSIVTGNNIDPTSASFCPPDSPSGGGIYNSGAMTVTNSAIISNSIMYYSCDSNTGVGGGIYNSGIITITNSTVSDNSISGEGNGYGAGIDNNGVVLLDNATVSGNSIWYYGQGAGLNGGIAVLKNTILADNTTASDSDDSDCYGTLTSQGHNLIGSTLFCEFTGDTTGDITDLDPQLGPLQNNGGPTFTMALLPRSAAIDGGNPAGCTDAKGNLLTTDQRGYTRPSVPGGICDIGAYEYGATAPTMTPSPTPSSTPLQPTVTPTSTPTPIPTPTSGTHSFTLTVVAGWNLIDFPLMPTTPLTAQNVLAGIMQSGGGTLVELAQWDGIGWVTYLDQGGSFLGDNFTISPYQGYFLYSDHAATYVLTGQSTAEAERP